MSENVPVRGRILVMGDSISDDGRYVAMLNTYLAAVDCRDTYFYNAGVSSETLSGLSEPCHPFPRPCGLDRLDRALELTQPDWVLVLYGMNDGIYYPLAEERFAEFRRGVQEMTDRIHAAGCRVILATPTPFDVKSYTGPLYPLGEADYGYNKSYEGYDKVLEAYSQWIMDAVPSKAELVVDMRTPLLQDRTDLYAENPGISTGDGIHPNDHGHWIMARTLIHALFGRKLTDWGDRLTTNEKLWETILKGELTAHRQLKEKIGHGLPDKMIILPETELRAVVDHAYARRMGLLHEVPLV